MFSKNLARLRKEKGLSQYELAARLGFSRGKLANYEQGTRQPDFDTLKLIADYFEVSTDYLLGRDASSSEEQVTFDEFIQDNDLREWYKKLGQAPEADLADLKVFYETFIAKKHEK